MFVCVTRGVLVGRLGLGLSLGAVVAGCGEPQGALPSGTCRASVWTIPARSSTTPAVIGQWTDWSEPTDMTRFDERWWVAQLALPPGEYGYLVVEQGEAHLDANNGLGGWREADGVEVSWLVVDDCTQPRVSADPALPGAVIPLALWPASEGAEIVAVEVAVDGPARPPVVVDAGASSVMLDLPALPRGRHLLELRARDDDGRTGPASRQVLWSEPIAERDDDGIIYQVVIDRFRGDGGAVLAAPPNPGARAGGTLDGVRAELERGTFEALGVSTLWLSPVYVNPTELRAGRDDDHVYEGYHGYWPVDTRAVDERIGGDAALDALVASAHALGVRVVLDVVPNHYDETNPRVTEHAADGWFNDRDPTCICGAADCPWSTEIATCWFTPYLPDVRLQQPDALAAAIDDAVWWQDRFALDGFRVDAVPMMPRAATRRIYHAVRRAVGPPAQTLLLGEVFTGPGDAGIAALRYHVGPDGLDSVFDFPTMWSLREAISGRGGLDALVEILEAQDVALAGSGVVLARMLGNHDTTRIASMVAGDEGRDPWDDPPPSVVDAEVLARVRLGFALVFTLPGMPVIYYGDEVGLPGAADPDSRRVMPDLDALGAAPLGLAAEVAKLGRLRRCMPTMRRGQWRSIGATAEQLAFVRELEGEASALMLLSSAAVATLIRIPAAVEPGWYIDAMSGARFEIGEAGAQFELPPFGVLVLIPEEHACA